MAESSLLADAEARRRVAEELKTTFVVRAGAGTGKTTVLLQRLLSLIRLGASRLDRIAAITFTEKAASELKVRLRAEIEAALRTFPPEGEQHVPAGHRPVGTPQRGHRSERAKR